MGRKWTDDDQNIFIRAMIVFGHGFAFIVAVVYMVLLAVTSPKKQLDGQLRQDTSLEICDE